MEKARAAIKDFTSRSGHHDTTVHETVAPAVQHETIKPHQHEEVNTAIDKEVHQDHYHRTVQPVQDREVLPEQHTHNLGAVQHREFDHRDNDTIKRNLKMEAAQFEDKRVVTETTHSQSAAPVVGGEHVHHHIHETIQPVVHKETVQPQVVHTTVPIHETHHNAAKHHEASVLPIVKMSDFKDRGGVLGGREERYDGFEGEPKHIGGTLQGLKEGVTGHHSKHGSANHAGSGMAAGAAGHHRRGSNSSISSSDEESRRTGHKTGRSGLTGTRETGTTGTTTAKKPSMLDKLNPKKDTDGDGKKGIMK